MMRLLATALLLLSSCDYQASTNRWPPPAAYAYPTVAQEQRRPPDRQRAKQAPQTAPQDNERLKAARDRIEYDFDKMDGVIRSHLDEKKAATSGAPQSTNGR